MRLKKIILLSIIILFGVSCFSQISDTDSIEGNIDSLINSGYLVEAIDKYKVLMSNKELNDYHYLEVAKCFAIINEVDSAYTYLDKLIFNYPNYSEINDLLGADLYYLCSDNRWIPYLSKIFDNYNSSKGLPKPIKYEFSIQLLSLSALDQSFYYHVSLSEMRYGRNSPVTKAIWEVKNLINKSNVKTLKFLIEQYGWPNISEVGAIAASKAFFLIQHSDLKTQKEFLPYFTNAYECNEAKFNWIAMITDRILLRENKPQKYGSQGIWNPNIKQYVTYEIEKPDSVNYWRKKYNLGPPISDRAIKNMYRPPVK